MLRVFPEPQCSYFDFLHDQEQEVNQHKDLHTPVLMGLGGLTCFVGYCVGFGHRLFVTQIDRGAPLKSRSQSEIQHDTVKERQQISITQLQTSRTAPIMVQPIVAQHLNSSKMSLSASLAHH